MMKKVRGNIVDIHSRSVFSGELHIEGETIKEVIHKDHGVNTFLLPGFIDAHVHIESSMLVPSEFSRLALPHGTVATISDPHEIANVLGVEGVKYMIQNASTVPLKIYFGAPSCVPATPFEQAGAAIGAEDIERLLQNPAIKYLAEMMNYPGVLHKDRDVIEKIRKAQNVGKPIDGHAPGLRGNAMLEYFNAGISTDHECFTLEEGMEKAQAGVHILIREGSAAKNFDVLIPILKTYPEQVMFCSDDKHPDDLVEGHINQIVTRALALGYDLFDVLRAACLNPILHYGLEVGTLRRGDKADFIRIADLKSFSVKEVYIDGKRVVDEGRVLFPTSKALVINNFNAKRCTEADFRITRRKGSCKVIKAIDGELITESYKVDPPVIGQYILADPKTDVLKLAVLNRYHPASPALALIHGFGLKRGAIASSVAHDSHNIIAVGIDDNMIAKSVNLIVENKGGIAAVSGDERHILPLPVAGIMAVEDGQKVASDYAKIDHFVKSGLGSKLRAPFMTLSFMALLVIPELKLSDQGLFDGSAFKFTSLFDSD